MSSIVLILIIRTIITNIPPTARHSYSTVSHNVFASNDRNILHALGDALNSGDAGNTAGREAAREELSYIGKLFSSLLKTEGLFLIVG